MEGTEPDLEGINDLLKGESLVVTSYLDSGGSGDLFLGRQENLDREVAIKMIPVCRAEAAGSSILREGQIVARLSHPHIVGVYDAKLLGEPGDWYCCLVMEFIEGTNLAKSYPVSMEEVSRIMFQICEAMEYAHAEGVIHCDLRPGNILLDQRRQAKVTDFGISRFADQEEGGPLITGGDYLAPEQLIRGSDPGDPRRDVYSLGILLMEMIRTFDSGEGSFGSNSSLERKLQAIAERAADGNLESRIVSVTKLKEELAGLVPVSRTGLKKAVLMLVAGLCFMGGAFFLFGRSGDDEEVAHDGKEPIFAIADHPEPLPVITDVSPTEILNTAKGFWLEIRGRNFSPTQNYYCFASDLLLADDTQEDNSLATFVDETLLKVWVEGVAPNSHGDGYVAVRWGKSIDQGATKKFLHAYVITREERN